MVLSRLAAGSSVFSWRPCFSFFALYGKIQLMKRRNGGDEARGEFPNCGPDGSGTRSACGGTLVTGFFGIVYRRGHYRHAGWSRGPWDGGARVLLAPGWTAPLTWCFLQRRLSACCLVCGPCFHQQSGWERWRRLSSGAPYSHCACCGLAVFRLCIPASTSWRERDFSACPIS